MRMPFFSAVLTAILAAGPLFSGAAQSGGSLTMGVSELPEGQGNPWTSGGFPHLLVWPGLFDALTELGVDGELKPALALAWDTENETTWLFRLREDVRFSNGEPFDAEAAAWNLNYLLSEQGQRYSAYRELRTVSAARPRDQYTLEIKTSQPDSMLPGRLAGVRMVPPRYFQEVGADAFGHAPHGTGTFMAVDWGAATVRYAPSPFAWRPPRIDEVRFVALPDQTSRIQAAVSGAVDVAFDINPDDVFQIEAAGGRVEYRQRASVQMWQFITELESPLQDVRVRRALNYAVNKRVIVDVLLAGATRPATQIAAKGTIGFDPSLPGYPYDPEKARTLLADAGYPDGFDITFQIYAPSPAEASIYQQAASDLEAAGVRVTVVSVPSQKHLAGVYNGDWIGKAFNMNYGSLPSLDPMASLRYHSCLWQTPWICRPEIADRALAVDREFDTEKRRALVRGILRDLHDDPPGIFLYDNVHADAIGARVGDYQAPFGFIRYHLLGVAGSP